MGTNQLYYNIRYNERSNLHLGLDNAFQTGAFTDVTLACEGHLIKCHKIVLAACSPHFHQLFLDDDRRDPIIYLKDIQLAEIEALLKYMYKGEVIIRRDQLPVLLQAGEMFSVKGFIEDHQRAGEGGSSNPNHSVTPNSSTQMHIDDHSVTPNSSTQMHEDNHSVTPNSSTQMNEDNDSVSPDSDDNKHGGGSGRGSNQKPKLTTYKKYTSTNLYAAIGAVRGGMSPVKAARKFGVPSRTLYDKVKKLGINWNRPMLPDQGATPGRD